MLNTIWKREYAIAVSYLAEGRVMAGMAIAIIIKTGMKTLNDSFAFVLMQSPRLSWMKTMYLN